MVLERPRVYILKRMYTKIPWKSGLSLCYFIGEGLYGLSTRNPRNLPGLGFHVETR